MPSETTAYVKIRGLSKHFGGARALSAVDMDIYCGEVHSLVGANGAGKSTLIRCLAGVVSPDEGSIEIAGEEGRLANPKEAERAGLAFIHQELNLVPHFNAVQNMLLGLKKPTRLGFIDWKKTRRIAVDVANRLGIDFSLDRRVSELSVADRWLVMIAKALVQDAKIIAMDEPTASLSDNESEKLFSIIRDLSAAGVGILYVSHRLDEVLDLSDRITVFRDGRVTDQETRGGLDKPGLVRAIVGRDVTPAQTRVSREVVRDRALFSAQNISNGGIVKDVSFELFPGEILGLGGLVGAGRTEVARLAFGADNLTQGEFVLEGSPLPHSSIPRSVQAGIGLVPEERRSQGLILEKSVAYNINISVLKSLRALTWLPFVNEKKSKSRATALIQKLQIKTQGPKQVIGSLSGGNQQKALIGRWLHPGVKVLFLDEPSRGVDVGAREEIHEAIRELADNGIGTVVISSENEELVALCDRIVVLSEGEVSGELIDQEVTENNIISLSYAHQHSQGDAS